MHHRNENCVFVHRLLDGMEVNDPITPNRKHLDLESLVSKRQSRLDHRTVLGLHGDNLPSPSSRSCGT